MLFLSRGDKFFQGTDMPTDVNAMVGKQTLVGTLVLVLGSGSGSGSVLLCFGVLSFQSSF